MNPKKTLDDSECPARRLFNLSERRCNGCGLVLHFADDWWTIRRETGNDVFYCVSCA